MGLLLADCGIWGAIFSGVVFVKVALRNSESCGKGCGGILLAAGYPPPEEGQEIRINHTLIRHQVFSDSLRALCLAPFRVCYLWHE